MGFAGSTDLLLTVCHPRRIDLRRSAIYWLYTKAGFGSKKRLHLKDGVEMEDLKAQFDRACARAKELPRRPDNETMLKLYALYKQATTGDVSGKRPGFTDPVGRAKYDAWRKVTGMPEDAAMKAYVELVHKLAG